tara:strand:- start:1609 stop:2925 length:1317 start_codon:yes stop_codon:yes gene_type:complete
MKQLYFLDEEERQRILNIHESATKRHYLNEQANNSTFDITNPYSINNRNSIFNKDGIAQGMEGDPYQYRYFNNKVYYAKKSDGVNPKWIEVKKQIGIEAIRTKIFNLPPSNGVKTPPVKTPPLKTQEKKGNEKSNKKVKKELISKYKYTPRIDTELKYIIDRDLDDKPFFIYDGKENLIYLFDMSKGNWFSPVPPILIDYTSVVDGADVQQQEAEPFTHQDWCKVSGLDSTPSLCTNNKAKTFEDCMTAGKGKSPKFDSKTQLCTYGASYGSLIKIAKRFLPKGIYSVRRLGRDEGYVGSGKNVFSLKSSDGENVAAAIHGIPAGLPERLTASKDLELLLKKDISSGKVPQKYLESTKQIAYANQSFGCIGVPAKFIENPKVQKLAKGARVFVMGQSNNDFLVQNSSEFFDKLHGDGQQCVDPIMLAQSLGDNNSAVV